MNNDFVFLEKVIEIILKQWTAFSIAVEYSDEPEETFLELKKEIISLCLQKKDNIERYDLEDLIIWFFEKHLSTILEDNSESCVSCLIIEALNISCEKKQEFIKKIILNNSKNF